MSSPKPGLLIPSALGPPLARSARWVTGRLRSRFGWILIACFQASLGWAQGVHLRQIDTQQGLSHNTVNALAQDDQGFMWIGTADGLDRYDGYTFKVHKPLHGIAGTLADNEVTALRASHEVLWVGCGNGLEKYIFQTGTFERLPQLDGCRIHAIEESNDGTLWVATSRGLCAIDIANGTLHFQTPQGLADQPCYALANTAGMLAIGTDQGYLRWSFHQPQIESRLPMEPVRALFPDSNDSHWIASARGVSRISTRESEPRVLQSWTAPELQGASCFAKDRDGFVWLGTAHGLFRRQGSGDWQEVTLHRDGTQVGIKAVRQLFFDRSGLLWIATLRMGLFLRDPNADFVRHYSLPGEPGMRAFVEDGQAIWLAGSRDLFRLETQNPFKPPRHLKHVDQDLTALSLGPTNHLYLGTSHQGVQDYAIDTGRITPLTATAGLGQIRQLACANGSLWISTGSALHRYLLDSGQITSWRQGSGLPTAECHSMFLNENGELYLGGTGLLMAFTPSTNTFESWKVKERSVRAEPRLQVLFQFKPDELWIGTHQGLLQFDRRRGSFRGWTTADGLPNDDIRGLTSDAQGQLWVSTQQGLARLPPGNTKFKGLAARDSALANEFLLGSALQTSDDYLLFGGQDGINLVSPNLWHSTTYQPEIVFTQLQIQNEPVQPGPKSVLKSSIETSKFLEMHYGHYMISFQFAALDFTQPDLNRYAYKLESHDRDWTYVAAEFRTANFTHLEPGAYTLRVKGTNHDGLWSAEEASTFLVIRPPWWRTTWAYVSYGLLLLAIVSIWPILHLRATKRRRLQLEHLIAVRNRDLETKNHELRNMNHILRAINETTNRNSLMSVLLEKGGLLVPRAEKSRFLFKDDRDPCYRYSAANGYQDHNLADLRLSREQALAFYAPEDQRMASGIYKIVAPHTHPIGALDAPACTLSMTLMVGTTLAGFLIFDNASDARAFDQSDVERLLRLRDHAVTATGRILLMEELQQTTHHLTETRSQLMEAAHLAGRTDTITSLLHNIGNALNSLNVSATILQKEMTGEEALSMLGRLVGLMEEHREDLAEFLTVDLRGQRLPQALRDLHTLLVENRQNLVQEVTGFAGTVDNICNIINAEQRNANGHYLEEDVSLVELFDNVLRMFGDSLSRERIRVTYRNLETGRVRVQRAKFVQVIGNLLQNAREAMLNLPPERERVLSIAARLLDREVELTISDTGPGIDSAIATKIFQQGFTTKLNGTGYGLHYCANAMTEMRGTIRVCSDSRRDCGAGACFTLTLPLGQGPTQSQS